MRLRWGALGVIVATACASSPRLPSRSIPDEGEFLTVVRALDPQWTDDPDERRERDRAWARSRRAPGAKRSLLVATVGRMMMRHEDRGPGPDQGLAPIECAAPAVADLMIEAGRERYRWLADVEPAHHGFAIVEVATRCMLDDTPDSDADARTATLRARVALHHRAAAFSIPDPPHEPLEPVSPPPDVSELDAALALSCRLGWPSATGPQSCATTRRSSEPLGFAPWVNPARSETSRADEWAQILTLQTLLEAADPATPDYPQYLFLLAREYTALELGGDSTRLANAAAGRALELLDPLANDSRYSRFHRRDEAIIRAIEIAWRTGDSELGCRVIQEVIGMDTREPTLSTIRDMVQRLECASRPASELEGEDDGEP